MIECPPLAALCLKIFESGREPADWDGLGDDTRMASFVWHAQLHGNRVLGVLVLSLYDARDPEPGLSDTDFPPERICHHNLRPGTRYVVSSGTLALFQLVDVAHQETEAFTSTKQPAPDGPSQLIALRLLRLSRDTDDLHWRMIRGLPIHTRIPLTLP